MKEAGFSLVEVVDSEADLNAYAKVENQGGRCPPTDPQELVVVEDNCCSLMADSDALHRRLLELLTRYDVNDFAASVKVFAVKP